VQKSLFIICAPANKQGARVLLPKSHNHRPLAVFLAVPPGRPVSRGL
jgi:hypothetical protein